MSAPGCRCSSPKAGLASMRPDSGGNLNQKNHLRFIGEAVRGNRAELHECKCCSATKPPYP